MSTAFSCQCIVCFVISVILKHLLFQGAHLLILLIVVGFHCFTVVSDTLVPCHSALFSDTSVLHTEWLCRNEQKALETPLAWALKCVRW